MRPEWPKRDPSRLNQQKRIMEELLKRVQHDLSKAEARLDQYEKGTLEYEFNYGVMISLLIVLGDIKELSL
jgi:hypothetical protein